MPHTNPQLCVPGATACQASYFWACSSVQTASMITIEHASGSAFVPPPQDASSFSFPRHRPSEFLMPVPQP